MSHEQERTIEAIAHEAIALTASAIDAPPAPLTSRFQQSSAAALERMSRMLHVQLHDMSAGDDLHAIAARIVAQTWLFGHALLLLEESIEPELARYEDAAQALVLGSPAAQARVLGSPAAQALVLGPEPAGADAATAPPSLLAIARRLDAHMYGTTDPPRAFQRHLRSFYDEIDVSGIEGSRAVLQAGPTRVRAARVDYLRVSLWVLLFLAHDHHAAIGAAEEAAAARGLFDRLRAATDEFYARRRQARSATST